MKLRLFIFSSSISLCLVKSSECRSQKTLSTPKCKKWNEIVVSERSLRAEEARARTPGRHGPPRFFSEITNWCVIRAPEPHQALRGTAIMQSVEHHRELE